MECVLQRSVVSDEQKLALRYAFAHNAYPTSAILERIGQCTGLSTRTVTNWFYNQRCRTKLHTQNPALLEARKVLLICLIS